MIRSENSPWWISVTLVVPVFSKKKLADSLTRKIPSLFLRFWRGGCNPRTSARR
jgi:hypothetical protein